MKDVSLVEIVVAGDRVDEIGRQITRLTRQMDILAPHDDPVADKLWWKLYREVNALAAESRALLESIGA